jgi:hypothetical protein
LCTQVWYGPSALLSAARERPPPSRPSARILHRQRGVSGGSGQNAQGRTEAGSKMTTFLFCICCLCACTAKEGSMRIQYKCLVPICVFPERKLLFPKQNFNVLPPSSFTYISVRDSYPGSVCLFCCRKICGPILGIYKSLTDT